MSGIVRAYAPSDSQAVATLFLRIFRREQSTPPRSLAAYFDQTFLRAAPDSNESASRVYLDGDGRVTGFIGVLPQRYRLGNGSLDVAFAGSLMVEDPAADPMAGARLMRSVATSGYAATLSETANPLSRRMWEKMGGRAIAGYSLDHIHILQPSGFALALASLKIGALRHAAPAARLVDRFGLARFAGPPPAEPGYRDTPIGVEEAVALLARFIEARGFRPEWPETTIAARIGEALNKRLLGEACLHAVVDRRDKPVGLFLLHGRRGGISHVLQCLADPGRERAVATCLVAAAHRLGAVAIKGRAEAGMIGAWSEIGSILVRRGALTVHGGSDELIAALDAGDAFVTGLAAETWNRLIGDRFD